MVLLLLIKDAQKQNVNAGQAMVRGPLILMESGMQRCCCGARPAKLEAFPASSTCKVGFRTPQQHACPKLKSRHAGTISTCWWHADQGLEGYTKVPPGLVHPDVDSA